MRISVIRTGGFAGIERRAELDTVGLSGARELEDLARRAVGTGEQATPHGVPDGFRYEVAVDGRTVHWADPELTEAQRELVRSVLREGA